MGKELNGLNRMIAPLRDLSIKEARTSEVRRGNPNRPLFSQESLREHGVPGYIGEEPEI